MGNSMSGFVLAGDSSGAITLQASSVAGTNTITLPAETGTVLTTANTQIAAKSDVIGVGQTWQDVTSSRAKTTTYTNSTGRPIQVSVNVNLQGTGQALNSLIVNGLVVGYQTQNTAGIQSGITSQLTAIVPAGSTYSVTGQGTITSWFELR
jgi:hypothetical protein